MSLALKMAAAMMGGGSVAVDPYWSSVSCLLHMDGSDGGTTFTDQKGKTVTATNCTTVNANALSGFSQCATFNGTSSKLSVASSVDFALTGDFTIEFAMRPTTISGNRTVVYVGNGTSIVGSNFQLLMNASGNLVFEGYYGTSGFFDLTSTSALSLNTWYKIGVTRSGSTYTIYIDGVSAGSGSFAAINTNTLPLTLGNDLGTLWYAGQLDELRVTKGVVRTITNFSAPFPDGNTTTDPYLSSVTLLAHMDGTNGSTTLVDTKGILNPTASGTSALSTAQAKFGTASCRIPGGQDNVPYMAHTGSTNYTYGTGDFTIEFWFRLDAVNGTDQVLYDGRDAGVSNDTRPTIAIIPSNVLTYYVLGAYRITGTTVPSANTWYHVAVCRNNGSTRLFLNGVQEGSTWADTTNYTGNNNRPVFMESSAGAGAQSVGYIDDIRITKGIGRYITNFTPPTDAFPETQGTPTDIYLNLVTLLANFDNNLLDSKGINIITASGNASVSASGLALDGSGDYVTLSSNSSFTFTGDFTVEAIVRPASTADGTVFYLNGNSTSTAGVRVGTINNGVYLLMSANGTTWVINSGVIGSAAINNDHHIAVARSGSNVYFYLNGVQIGTTYGFSGTPYAGTIDQIGRCTGAALDFNGVIKAARVTKGACRYPAGTTFTPPTRPFLNS